MKVILQGLHSKLLITQGYGTAGEPEPEQPFVYLTPSRAAQVPTGSRGSGNELTGSRLP